MPDLDYVRVVGRLGIVVVDAAADDPDVNPDTIWCDEGTVLFTPLITSVKVVGATPVPATLGQSTIAAEVDSEGYISLRGTRAINLVDLTSPKVNPTIGEGKATHKVEFLGLAADGNPVNFTSPVNVRFAADNVDPDTGSIDITLVSPVPVAGGTAQIMGPKGDSAYQTWLLQGNTGTFNDFMAQYVEVEIPPRLQAKQGETSAMLNDANNALESGFYHVVSDGVNDAHLPVGHSQVSLIVSAPDGAAGYANQIALTFVAGTRDAFFRSLNNGLWTDWSQFLDTSDTFWNDMDTRYLNIGEGIQDAMLPARLRNSANYVLDGDWNNASTSGWYASDPPHTNVPSGLENAAVMGEVINHGGWIEQRIWSLYGTNANDTVMFRRTRQADPGTWSAWYRIRQSEAELDARYLNIGEGIQDSMLPARLQGVAAAYVEDLNAITESGFYRAPSTSANLPVDWPGGAALIFSVNYESFYSTQEIWDVDHVFAAGVPQKKIWRRHSRWNNDLREWSPWYLLSDTQEGNDARYLNIGEGIQDSMLPARLRESATYVVDNDWNNARQTGWYRDAGSALNRPDVDSVYFVEVYGTDPISGYVTQTAHDVFSTNASDSKIFRRYLVNNVWSAWFRVRQTEAELDARYKKHAVLGDTTSLVQSDMRIAKDPASSTSLPVGWSNYSYGTGSAFGESANDKPGSGGRYLVLYANANSLGGVVSDFFPVTPNGLYQFSVDLWKAGNYPGVILRLEWFDGSQNYLGYNDVWYANNNSAPIPELGGDTSPYVVTPNAVSPPVNADYGRALILNDQNGVGDSYLVVINPTVHKVTNRGIPARLGGNIGATAKHLSGAGTTNDWNSATETGWYMSDNASNAPGPGWYIGEVVSHNTSWVTQEVWQFTAGNPSENRWRRYSNNGNWGAWQKVAPTGLGNYFDSALTLNDANDAQSNGIYYVNNATPNTPIAWWGVIAVTRYGGEIHQEYRGMGNPQMGGSEAQVWRRWRAGDGNWTPWSKMLVDQIHQDYRFGVFGQALQSPLVTTPDDAVTPGVYDWQGGANTPPSAVFGLHGAVGAQLVVTSYDPTYVKQEARIWDTDQRWVRARNAGTWTPWVPTPNDQKDTRLAGIESGRNLVRNGKFSYVTDRTTGIARNLSLINTSIPGWRLGPVTGNGGTWVLGQGKAASGAQTTVGGRSLGLRPADSTSGIQVQSDPIPINAGKVYRVKFSVYNDDPIAQGLFFAVVWYDTVDTYIDGPGYLAQNYVVNNAGVASENQFVTHEGYVTAPDLAAAAILLPHAWVGSGSATSNTLFFTDIEFEEVIPTAALGDSGWQTPSAYYNNWGPLNDSTWPVRYRKIGNRVTLKGLLSGGVVSSSGEAGMALALPPGYRPFSEIHTPVANNASATDTGHSGVCRIFTNGSLQIISGANQWVSLDNMSFLVD